MRDWTRSDAAVDEHFRGIYGHSHGVDPIEGEPWTEPIEEDERWSYDDLDVIGEWDELEEEMEVELDG